MTVIGIDTNVLLRMVLNDDPSQRSAAVAFGKGLSKTSPGFVSLIVLVEFSWSLRSRYRQPKQTILQTIRDLLHTRGLIFESSDAVVRALEAAEKSQADFADAIIAERNLEHGCSHTVTFDREAAKAIPSMELLA